MFAPSRGRELKSISYFGRQRRGVRPLAGAGIEIMKQALKQQGFTFAPSRGRELKLHKLKNN